MITNGILFEHEDGRYAVDPDTTGEPKWHRMGPVTVHSAKVAAPSATPIDMVLYCPNCGKQHIDAPDAARKPKIEYTTDANGIRKVIPQPLGWSKRYWTNPPHRSHLCHSCGCIWRPADVPTNGVEAIKTHGKADSWVGKAPLASVAERGAKAAVPLTVLEGLCESVKDLDPNATGFHYRKGWNAALRSAMNYAHGGITTASQTEASKQEAQGGQAADGEIVITKNDAGHIVSVTRQNSEGVILKVLALSAPDLRSHTKGDTE